MKSLVIARVEKDWDDSVLISPLVEGVRKLALHPHGLHRGGRENDDEPVAASQRLADLVLPLLCPTKMTATIPDTHAVLLEHARESVHESAVARGVR